MKIYRKSLLTLISILSLLVLFLPGAAKAQQSGITRTDLQRHDISVAGYEAIQVRVDFKPGIEFGLHAHFGEEIIYVLEGILEYDIEGNPPVKLKAGDVFFVPAGKYHSAKNIGNNNAAELATYIVEKGKQILVMKEQDHSKNKL
ncbi:quercetin dioxygenase-like cupin family protein [Pedobacter cryoconitis]|uniref:Quercetin dioxygenase-like cupin family protein n=1 Tax=Pedobacter cryoconitis TaxID=188932 RepID=A0A7W8ZR55_9SPHI|nr:cupin domain-containing protein [Pedobacter cryoconitis]MBB5638327.1 quercetin dioxygenase-like cupin family protein [Pedobacter cryoconitis]